MTYRPPFRRIGAAALVCAAAILSSDHLSAQTISYTDFGTGAPEPVLQGGGAGAWDEIIREKVWVLEDGGQYRMWYVGHTSAGQTTSKVGYATSSDGIHWTRYPGNPVISRSNVKDQDICVVRREDGALNMYVEVNDSWIDVFTSTDGIAWTLHPASPVKTSAASPVVWREGSAWFMLYEYMAQTPFTIHLATSTDGLTWTDSPANPILAEPSDVVPDSVVKEGSTYHMYYHRYGNGWPEWHATSTDLTNWTARQQLFPGGTVALTSQMTYLGGDGRLRAYLWSETDRQYYLRYGVLRSGPTVWPLDENGGTVVSDSSGHSAEGVLKNGPLWIAGPSGSALSFDGVDDSAPLGFFANLSTWTVVARVRSPAAPASGPASGPVHRHANFQINWNHPAQSARGAVGLKVAGIYYSASFGALQANRWYHLVGTYDGETLRAYRDGVLISTNSAPSGPPDPESAPLMLGRHARNLDFFHGDVDDVRVYGSVLSDAQIAALASGAPPPPPDTTAPSAPGALSGTAAGQSVQLNWSAASDAESGIASYQLYRGTVSGPGKVAIATVGSSTLAYVDTSTQATTSYFYEVRATNGAGLEGPASNEVNVVTGDDPPAAPTGLVATGGDGTVVLDWSTSPEGDLAGYRVYRSAAPEGPFAPLGPSLLVTSDFIDNTVVNGTTYFYVVTAVDAASHESAASAAAGATPQAPGSANLLGAWDFDEGTGVSAFDSSGNGYTGTLRNGAAWTGGISGTGISFDGIDDYVSTNFSLTPATWTVAAWVRSPTAPANASPSGPVQRQNSFQLNWNHTDAAFRGAIAVRVGSWYSASFGTLNANTWYHLAATYDGETLKAYKNGVLITSNTAPSGAPNTDSATLKFGRQSSTANYFEGSIDDVRIYDGALGDAAIAALASFDETAPTAPAGFDAVAAGQQVNLSWTAAQDTESGIRTYRVYRGTEAGGSKSLLTEVPGTEVVYTDAATQPATQYFYQVSAVNGAGQEGARSLEAGALTGNTPPSVPSGVTAAGQTAQISIDWLDNVESDLAGYRVYRGTTAGGPYAPATPDVVTVSTFTDTSVLDGQTYFYVVTAVDLSGLESGVSTEVSAAAAAGGAGLVAYWAMNEGTGTLTADSSGNGWTATMRSGAVWTTGLSGPAIAFDGVDDNLTTNFAQDLPAWTVAVWVRGAAAPAALPVSGPVSRNSNFQLNWNHTDANFRGAVALRTAGGWFSASFGELDADRWYFLVGTYDGETLRAYKDGVLVSTNESPSGPPRPDTVALRMGRQATAGNFFQGMIDDVRVYDRPLTGNEISVLFGRGPQ